MRGRLIEAPRCAGDAAGPRLGPVVGAAGTAGAAGKAGVAGAAGGPSGGQTAARMPQARHLGAPSRSGQKFRNVQTVQLHARGMLKLMIGAPERWMEGGDGDGDVGNVCVCVGGQCYRRRPG